MKDKHKKMTEALQTRIEHSRSIDDAERYRALHTLQDLGMLIPLNEVETFHGRVGRDGEAEWAIDPTFANGGNDSGNANVNSRPTLYTGEREVAEDFADRRLQISAKTLYRSSFISRVSNYTAEQRRSWLGRLNREARKRWEAMTPAQQDVYGKPQDLTLDNLDSELRVRTEALRLERDSSEDEKRQAFEGAVAGLRAEVHAIVSADSDATIYNNEFSPDSLDEGQRTRYEEALHALLINLTAGSPVGFNDRGAIKLFSDAIRGMNAALLPSSEIPDLAHKAGLDERVVTQLVGAYNAMRIAGVQPGYLIKLLTHNEGDFVTENLVIGDTRQDVVINLEYVQRYLRMAHIVGVRQKVDSFTLNRTITSISLFDLEKVTTPGFLEKQQQSTLRRLGGLATSFSETLPAENRAKPLLQLLRHPYARPEQLVEAAQQVDGYREIFDGDAGNWEGFTLAEHTETVLRNFDENYADTLPVDMLPIMRLAILAHDVGKPGAVANGEKHKQKDYNAAQAKDFFDKLHIDDRLQAVLLTLIGDGMDIAFQTEIRGD